MATKLFDQAKKNKADEFYTQLKDIEMEVKNYKSQFKDKVVFCNCDDPYESNFFKYFALNFEHLKLKKLIAIGYDPSPVSGEEIDLFNYMVNNGYSSTAYKIEIVETPDLNNDGAVDINDIRSLLQGGRNVLTRLKGDGDFRSEESIQALKEADIVVTNPPFSLFREYVLQLEEYNKDFLIIGNTNALTYKDIFKMFKDDKIRTGYTNFNVGMYFIVPDYYERYTNIIDGVKYARVSTSCWFTNLSVEKHNENLTLYKTYDPRIFPKYENYNAINIDTYKHIPYDYEGEMGVPITFLDKYNPKQFEIVALGIVGSIEFSSERKMEILKKGEATGKYTVNAKGTLYRKWDPEIDVKPAAFKDVKSGELYQSIYARIIIKKR